MGELVMFRPKVIQSRPTAAGGLSAEILFFTGVQIVRVEAVEITPKPGRRRSGVRSDSLRKRRDRAT